MTQTKMASRKRWTTALAASFLALAATGGTMASGASAATGDRTVTGGSLEWGVKASFRNYMVGPIASGSITPSDGASVDAAKVATFGGGNGAVTADGSAHIAYKGSVHYYGHDGELDFTLSDPYVMVDKAGTGSLYVNYAVGKGTAKRVKIAALSGSGPVVSGDIATVSNAAAKLTQEGVEVFSYKGHGFYEAGTDLDAVNAKATLAPEATTPPVTPPTTDPGTTDPGTTNPGTTDPGTTDPGTTTPANPSLSIATAGTKQVGQTTYAWGKLSGATNPQKVCTQFLTAPGTWSQSQCATTGADGSYAIPLTYGAFTPGTYAVRTVSGSATSSEATLTRVANPTLSVATAGTKKIGQVTYAWGKLSNGSNPTKVCTQVVVNGKWSQSQCGMTSVDGSYALPLTYGATTPGKYTVRVVAGPVSSVVTSLTRTR